MRQKLITLCPNSFELAQKKNNFSEWVRQKLLDERELTKDTHLHKCVLGCQLVTDFKASPMCPQHKTRMKWVPSVQLTLGGLHDSDL